MTWCNRYNRMTYDCSDFRTPSETRVLRTCHNRTGHSNQNFVNIPQTRVDFGIPFYNIN